MAVPTPDGYNFSTAVMDSRVFVWVIVEIASGRDVTVGIIG